MKTFKEARECGFRPIRADQYGGDQIVIKGKTYARNAQVAKSKSAWSREGLRVRTGELPHAIVRAPRVGEFEVFRGDQVEAKKSPPMARAESATPENVARACWTVNRSAKRFRDAAQSTYRSRAHGLASTNKQRKDNLYLLKDRAIAWLATRGHLEFKRTHGGLSLFEGLGYSFHSRLLPPGRSPSDAESEPIKIEAKPKTSAEMRLIDADALIRTLDDHTQEFRCAPAPTMARPDRRRPTVTIAADHDDDSLDDSVGDHEDLRGL
jgi:hypothetical protein